MNVGFFPDFSRKIKSFLDCWHLYDSIFVFLFTGCNRSSESRVIYTKCVAHETMLVTIIVVILFSAVFSSYAFIAVFWLSTLIFGVPSFEYWILPYGSTDP